MADSGLGPVGQGISALCSAHPRAAEPRACQDVVPFSCGLGVNAHRGSIGCAQAAGGPSASRDAELCACVSQEATACGSAHGGSIAPGPGAGRQARTRVAGRVSRARAHRRRQGIRTAHVRSGSARGRWSSSASGFGVSGPGEFHSRVWRSVTHVDKRATQSRAAAVLRNRKRALHNTKLCSNRPVTEAGPARPRELPGCMSALLCRTMCNRQRQHVQSARLPLPPNRRNVKGNA